MIILVCADSKFCRNASSGLKYSGYIYIVEHTFKLGNESHRNLPCMLAYKILLFVLFALLFVVLSTSMLSWRPFHNFDLFVY